jgi:hypothetical protein
MRAHTKGGQGAGGVTQDGSPEFKTLVPQKRKKKQKQKPRMILGLSLNADQIFY